MLTLTGVVLVAAASAQAGGVRTSKLVSFRMPSRNIACMYASAGATVRNPFLRCDVLSGLRPKPRARCRFDWSAVSMTRRGKARPRCVSDTVYDNRAPILRYGRTWRVGGFTCTSRRKGLRCRNLAGHGFFLSRSSWRVY